MFTVQSMWAMSLFFRWVLMASQKPLNPDACLAQIYPAKNFSFSSQRRGSKYNGPRRGPIIRRIFGQWMCADVYPLETAYVPFALLVSCAQILLLVARCTISTPAPIQQRSRQSLSRPIRSSMTPIRCSSSTRFLRTPVVCSGGFLSRGLSKVCGSSPKTSFAYLSCSQSVSCYPDTMSTSKCWCCAHRFHCSTSVYSAGAHYKVGFRSMTVVHSLELFAVLSQYGGFNYFIQGFSASGYNRTRYVRSVRKIDGVKFSQASV